MVCIHFPIWRPRPTETAWEEECTSPGAPNGRQGFFPDGSRSFEEIDRMSIGRRRRCESAIFYCNDRFSTVACRRRIHQGLPAHLRSDTGRGTSLGSPWHAFLRLQALSPRCRAATPALAKATNDMQALVSSGDYDGVIWTQGSPQVEESAYWFNLLIDTTLPICGNAAQRPQGQISADGPANIVDSVRFIRSRRLG